MKPEHEQNVPRRTTEVLLDAVMSSSDPVSRARAHEPALIMLQGDLPGQVFRLQPGRQLIGRRPECDIRVRERAVSGIHAEILRSKDGVLITDLESTNGTVVNGLPIRHSVTLVQGNLLKLGNCVFKFVDSLLEVEFTETLHARGITDQLTATYNHSYLISRLSFSLDTASELRPVSIVAFDFDEFKLINDQYGHAAGDHMLRCTAAAIRESCIRAGDLFARMGGEEFVVLQPDTALAGARVLAERMRRCLDDRTFLYGGQEIRLTASFGVCTATSPVEHAESLLARADELLYTSKREGRNRVSG